MPWLIAMSISAGAGFGVPGAGLGKGLTKASLLTGASPLVRV